MNLYGFQPWVQMTSSTPGTIRVAQQSYYPTENNYATWTNPTPFARTPYLNVHQPHPVSFPPAVVEWSPQRNGIATESSLASRPSDDQRHLSFPASDALRRHTDQRAQEGRDITPRFGRIRKSFARNSGVAMNDPRNRIN
ncbi:hypothetical protein NP233_g8474 [Leucocoprinus birnbaumii]|uniref:Uncharacterized protein n=1 Tax=Leucocoprinus birnbaumii TaxID=56174 RepID=A0AAD5VSR8_9AGAR|nr:hypothetical protein NP233_g8474 [Leucocoprinus birnbaumii]